MEFCPAIKKALLTGRNHFFLFLFIFSSHDLTAQETNSRASGKVFSDSNETVSGVTVTIIHEPTQNKYVDATRNDGYFHFFNLKPGGPYSVIFSSAGYETLKKTNLFIHLSGEHFFLGNSEVSDFFLQKKIMRLEEVVINAPDRSKTGIETNIASSS